MAKRQSSETNPKSTRRVGRPKRGEGVVTPAVIEKIASLWLRGTSLMQIGRQLEIDRSTVKYHLDHSIRPLWHEDLRSRLAEDLAKVSLLERTAWERFNSSAPSETHEQIEKALLEGGAKPRIVRQAVRKVTRTGEVAWIQVVQWCLDFRARIHGHYAPARHHVDHGGEFRVAGMTPCEVDQLMLQRLMEKIAERRRLAGLESGQPESEA